MSTFENLFNLDLNKIYFLYDLIYNKSLRYCFKNQFDSRELISEKISEMISEGK